MADPLSITASIISITVPALHGVRLLLNDVQRIIEAPQAVQNLRDDLAATELSLQSIREIKDWSVLGQPAEERFKSAIKSCGDSCITFHKKVVKWTNQSKEGKLTWHKRLSISFFKESQIKALSDQIQSSKITLDNAISIANLHISIRHTQISKDIRQKISASETGPLQNLKPLIHIPFPRDKDFVARGDILNQVAEKCSEPASRVALVGFGGVGKSQLAIEYCYQVFTRSPSTWVFWCHASTSDRLKEGFRDIVTRLKIPGHDDAQADVFKLCHDWMRDESHGKWLLVLDNVDDASVLSISGSGGDQTSRNSNDGTSQKYLSKYLPVSMNGSIVVTSRVKSVVAKLVEEDDILQVGPMKKGEAQTLLQKKLGTSVDQEGVQDLVEVLDYMPLAIAQAGAYLRRRIPRYSVQQYLEDFRRSDESKVSLLNQGAGHLRRDEEANSSIITTWQISFDHVQQVRPSAAALLALMSFFDRQGIPIELLQERRTESNSDLGSNSNPNAAIMNEEYSEHESVTKQKDNAILAKSSQTYARTFFNEHFEQDIVTLREYSFIAITANPDLLEMHRLVQLSTRKWLKAHGDFESTRDIYIATMSAHFPSWKVEDWAAYEALYPHLKNALAHKPGNNDATWYARKYRRYGEAVKISTLLTSANEELHGNYHIKTLESMRGLASQLHKEGRLQEAADIFADLITRSRETRGDEDYETLRFMSDSANVWISQSRFQEAEDLLRKVTGVFKEKLGGNHTETMLGMHGLARVLRNQGQYHEAKQIYTRLVNSSVIIDGENCRQTAAHLNDLAMTYDDMGNYEEAFMSYSRALDIAKVIYGQKHPETLICMYQLARNLSMRRDKTDAVHNLRDCLIRMKDVLGEKHIDTLGTMQVLASCLREQGCLSEATTLAGTCLKFRKEVSGEGHKTTLDTMHEYGECLEDEGRYEEAYEVAEKRFSLIKASVGEKDKSTLISMDMLGRILSLQGLCDDAITMLRDCLRLKTETLGDTDVETLISMHTYAWVMERKGQRAEAISLMKECIEKSRKVLGPEHPDTMSSIRELRRWERRC